MFPITNTTPVSPVTVTPSAPNTTNAFGTKPLPSMAIDPGTAFAKKVCLLHQIVIINEWESEYTTEFQASVVGNVSSAVLASVITPFASHAPAILRDPSTSIHVKRKIAFANQMLKENTAIDARLAPFSWIPTILRGANPASVSEKAPNAKKEIGPLEKWVISQMMMVQ